ncbi:MAG: thioredoxin family protein [Sphingomonadales bacterium]
MPLGRDDLRLLSLSIAVVALLLGVGSQGASAQERHAQVRLIPEQAIIAPGQAVTFALHMAPDPGWHTYWSNPGDAGIVTSIDWTLPEGFAAGGLRFPTPEKVPQGPLMNYGYGAPVSLLVDITVPEGATPGETIPIDAHVNWLVCDDKVCVPEDQAFSLSLPVGEKAMLNSQYSALFASARAALPQPSPWPARFSWSAEDGFVLKLDFGTDGLDLSDVWFFPDQDGLIAYAADQDWALNDNGLLVAVAAGGAAPGEEISGVLKLRAKDAGEAQGYRVTAARALEPLGRGGGVAAGVQPMSLGLALAFALLGGLILNLMPCVFPVLSLKALALAKMAGHERQARASGVFYTLGVLASFALIATILLVVRGLGAQVGWGFQLQSPLVVAALAYLMMLIGLNLLGVYQVGGGMMAWGDRLIRGEGRAASFLTGVLAAVVATPCTAPFMAAALGFALVQPAAVAMTVFLGLGLGLALPYLLLAYWPRLRRFLPQPGAWMERFKQFLAFPMFATALWLLWVIGQQGGVAAVVTVLAGVLAIGFALWAWQAGALAAKGRGRQLWRLIATAAMAVAIFGAIQANFNARVANTQPAVLAADRFTPQRLAQLRTAQQPVFVYFTAAWCITCKVNERLALETEQVKQAFDDRGVKVLKADWTNRDADIARTLRQYGRSGIPLYLYFAPGADAEILPQILTPGLIIDAVSSAQIGGAARLSG